MGAFEDGQTFLAGVLAKIPEGLRAQVKDAFEKPEAKEAVVLLGDGTLARSDYSKSMDRLKTQQTELEAKLAEANTLHEQQTKWYQTNEAALKEYPTLKAELAKRKAGGDDDDPPPPPPNTLDKKTIEELIDQTLTTRERDYVDVVAFMQDTGFRHHAMFSEPLVMRDLLQNPKLGKPILGQPGRIFSLQDAYTEKYGERVVAKQKEAQDKIINDEVEKRLKEKLAGQPFPLRGQPSPSVLDVLETKDGPAAHTLDTAVAEYERLQASRS